VGSTESEEEEEEQPQWREAAQQADADEPLGDSGGVGVYRPAAGSPYPSGVHILFVLGAF